MFGDFDEAAYLRANPDVRGLVERGLFRSGFEHWHAVGANEHALGDRVSGFYEHDLMYDEAAYLRQNPDVADAVRSRAVRNGYQHWIRFGRQEFARGTRLGPFRAPNGLLRPFRVSTGQRSLFVARAPVDFERVERVEVRIGSGAPSGVDAGSVICSRPLSVVDACGGSTTVRLLSMTIPTELDPGQEHVRNRVSVTIHAQPPASVVFTFRDRGVPAFFFPRADDANEFVAAALASEPHASAAAPVADFALERLVSSPRRPGYELPLTFRIERSSPAVGGGVTAGGWVALPPAELTRCRAWRVGRAEFFDLTRVWSRLSRRDVVERFPELAASGGDRFGFLADVKFRDPFPTSEKETLLFGVERAGGSEEWIEVDVGRLAVGSLRS
jgi:hypothetical protein